ncbi:MAG: zf-HC2 domain-containing protein [Candidatus Thiodiazotropha sp.]
MTHPSDRHPTELLPWLANGTLEGEERAAVEAHLADCETCRSELKLLRELRETIRAEPPAEAGDLGLQRLLRAVRQDAKRQTVWPRWLIPAALAASLVIAVQTVMLLQPGPQAPVYAPLSGASAGQGVLQVEFMPDAREADLRNLLRDAGARIVDGPSAVGLYRLAVAPGRDPQQVLERLRSHKTLVRHVALER